MTHTLHRFRKSSEKADDYVMLSMAAQGFNSEDAGPKLVKVFEIMVDGKPVNYGDDNQGGVFTGLTADEIIKNATNKAYMDAVYKDKESVKGVLAKLKEADLGMSVTVTGDMDDVFNIIVEAGLKPHTVNIPLGTFGNKKKLPDNNMLEILTMCGHGMVCKEHADYVLKRVKKGLMSAEDAAKELARPCTCGIFNVERTKQIIERECFEDGEMISHEN